MLEIQLSNLFSFGKVDNMHLAIQYYVLQSIKAKAKALCICKLNVVFYDYYSRHYLHIYIYIIACLLHNSLKYQHNYYNISNSNIQHN